MNKNEQAKYDEAIAAIEAGKLLEERRYSDGTVRHFLDGAAILDKSYLMVKVDGWKIEQYRLIKNATQAVFTLDVDKPSLRVDATPCARMV